MNICTSLLRIVNESLWDLLTSIDEPIQESTYDCLNLSESYSENFSLDGVRHSVWASIYNKIKEL